MDTMLARPSRKGDMVAIVDCALCRGTGWLDGDVACMNCEGGEVQANELHLAYTLIARVLNAESLQEAQTALQDANALLRTGHGTLELEESAATRTPTVWALIGETDGAGAARDRCAAVAAGGC